MSNGNRHWITRLRVNKSRRGTMLAMADPERLHAAIYAGFPNVGEGDRITWRMDRLYTGPVIYVVSPTRPDYTGFVETYGWPKKGYDEQVDTTGYDDALGSIREGDMLRFRLTSSTQMKRRGGNMPVRGIRGQEEWLFGRSHAHGFAIGRMDVTAAGTASVSGCGHMIRFPWAQYDGILTVERPDAFTSMLVDGIGREKAYGMGLMTVMPADRKEG